MSEIDWHGIFQARRISTEYNTAHLWIGEGEPVTGSFTVEEFLPLFAILAAALIHPDAAKYISNLPKEGIPWLKTRYPSLEFGNRGMVECHGRSFGEALGIDYLSVETGRVNTLLTLFTGNRGIQFALNRLTTTGLMEIDRANYPTFEDYGELQLVREIQLSWLRRTVDWDFGCFQDPVRWDSMIRTIENGVQALIRPETAVDFEFMYNEMGPTSFSQISHSASRLIYVILLLSLGRYRPIPIIKRRHRLPGGFQGWELSPKFIPHARKWRVSPATPRVCLHARQEFAQWLEAGGIRLEELEAWDKDENRSWEWLRDAYREFPARQRKSGFSYPGLQVPSSASA